ncbi:hypothetical protein [Mannheimia indoligenes]|uniref:hypothetical protein n=1 Tax=Mannheimia indoligenes TaxID=3103145 RepID=UPI002FE626E7
MEIFIGIVVVIILFSVWSAISSSKALSLAKENYERSLEKLKNDPSNANLKQQTLELGRVYANLTRDSKGTTTVDEVALMNDINAACASATATVQLSIEERLNKLSLLLEKEIITQEEYDLRRKEILENI